ncbi:MAG: hypothetical protein NVS3B20_19130 [Polyangiales bacterium]
MQRGAQIFRELCEVLGLLRASASEYLTRTREQRLRLIGIDAKEIEGKVEARVEARKAKDFAKADSLRKELELVGIEIFDTPTGTSWKKRV